MIARFFQLIVGAIFVASGYEHMVNSPQFASVLEFVFNIDNLPHSIWRGMALVVATIESMLGASLLTAWRPRFFAWATGMTLIAFSIVLLRLWMDPKAPPCRCTSWIRLVNHLNDSATFGLLRNAVLLGMVVVVALAHNRLQPSPHKN